MRQLISLFLIVCLFFGFACKQKAQTIIREEIYIPSFEADSAYDYTKEQISFGYRIPNTYEHELCGNYLVNTLRRFGASVTEQDMTLQIYNGQFIRAKNIIGSFGIRNQNRILLCAHWDSRPFADRDPNPENHHTPIDGANDGAGACAVLLELARQIGIQPPSIGIDILLFDAEDWGTPEFEEDKYFSSGWCLGSEYWAKNPHTEGYQAKYSILLDMVSAPNAQFYQEHYSMQYANDVLKKIWATAQAIGYGSHFINKEGLSVVDDHLNIIQYRKIPCVDIIHHYPDGFGSYWHTLDDNMNHVSKETLKAVGQTLLYLIYKEK